MAWIDSPSTLGRDVKTRRLMRALGISAPVAVGHVHFLWWWVLGLDHEHGVFEEPEPAIAAACEWEGDPSIFCAVLLKSGFLTMLDSRRYQVAYWPQLTASYRRSLLYAYNPEWAELRQAAIRRDGYICGLCGQSVPPQVVDIDHIIPRSKGGPDTLENVRVTHAHCNRSRGNRDDRVTS